MRRRRYGGKNVGARVLKAVSSGLRLKILTLLYERGPLSYTEIMNLLRLNPVRDAGRFAYHLKQLLKTDLIEPEVENKKYKLTDLGRKVVNFADDLEESAYVRRRMLVRTSRLAIEEFDRNKIAQSLIKEANVPVDLAQKIARETEKRLQETGAKYLTAPLIREFVNAILIERGLEEYRHKLTRLGMPVYDVTNLIKDLSESGSNVEDVHRRASNAVIGEYTLLSILPRDIADAHLSGDLHLNNIGCWILKPCEIIHDLRLFLRRGLRIEGWRPLLPCDPPEDFRSALSLAEDILRLTNPEVSGVQVIDYFNIFLAPFLIGYDPEEVKRSLRLFLTEINHSIPKAALGIELSTPTFLAEEEINYAGEKELKYSDITEESARLASLIIDVMLEEPRPCISPLLIIKVRSESIKDDTWRSILYKSHRLAIEKGGVYFANLGSEGQPPSSYTTAGSRLSGDWTGDWELDIIRTGSIESIILNIPRVSYNSGGNIRAFFERLYDLSEKAVRALEIKYLTMKQRVKEGLLPFLSGRTDGDIYYRLENATRLVSFVGLNEAVEHMTGERIGESSEALKFAEEILNHLAENIKELSSKSSARCALSSANSHEASYRLASLDVEEYGWGRVKVQGDRNNPSYTYMNITGWEGEAEIEDRLTLESRFHRLTPGGHLAIIPINNIEASAEKLLEISEEIIKKYPLGLYYYESGILYCTNCQRTFHGNLLKCPSCGSTDTTRIFNQKSYGSIRK